MVSGDISVMPIFVGVHWWGGACQMRLRSSKMRVLFFNRCLPYEIPHWLYISKFTRLRAVSRRQHGYCFHIHILPCWEYWMTPYTSTQPAYRTNHSTRPSCWRTTIAYWSCSACTVHCAVCCSCIVMSLLAGVPCVTNACCCCCCCCWWWSWRWWWCPSRVAAHLPASANELINRNRSLLIAVMNVAATSWLFWTAAIHVSYSLQGTQTTAAVIFILLSSVS